MDFTCLCWTSEIQHTHMVWKLCTSRDPSDPGPLWQWQDFDGNRYSEKNVIFQSKHLNSIIRSSASTQLRSISINSRISDPSIATNWHLFASIPAYFFSFWELEIICNLGVPGKTDFDNLKFCCWHFLISLVSVKVFLNFQLRQSWDCLWLRRCRDLHFPTTRSEFNQVQDAQGRNQAT